MTSRRVSVLAVLVFLFVLATAAPAGADPAEPTSDRSTVRRIDPPITGVQVAVVGGDSFLELRVEQGREVTVPGYSGESYLRFLPDGTVERNLRSPATYLNEDRFAASAAPSDLDPDDEPEWEQVATGGTYAWHDHRIHWMSPDRPPGLDPGDVIQEWEVPLVVDGTDVSIEGVLSWESPVSPLPWIGLSVAGAAATALLARRRSGLVSAGAALTAGVLASGVAFAERSGMPAGAQTGIVTVVVPVVAVLSASAALALWVGERRSASAVTTLLSVAATIGWALLRVDVFLEPVLPTPLEPTLDRAGTAIAVAISVGVAILVTRSDALARVAQVGPGREETARSS